MNDPTQEILNALLQTTGALLEGHFARLCQVKRTVLHLEAVYFCHSTCHLVGEPGYRGAAGPLSGGGAAAPKHGGLF